MPGSAPSGSSTSISGARLVPPTSRHCRIGLIALTTLMANVTISAQAPRRDGHGRGPLDEYNRALGIECSHCHVPEQWQDESKPAKATARKMTDMVTLLNGKLLR